MIIPSTKKILLVPDLGVKAKNETLTTLKADIESKGMYSVMIADLQKLVLNENVGKELCHSQVIELSARRLESLASDKTLIWENCEDNAPGGDPVHDFVWNEPKIDDIENFEPDPESGPAEKVLKNAFRRLNIKISESCRCDLNRSDSGKKNGRAVIYPP